jgi:hypothetical protein
VSELKDLLGPTVDGHWFIHRERDDWWQVRKVDADGGTSSHNFRTEEAARAKYAEWEANGRCRECGDVLAADFAESTRNKILAAKLCHSCLFWTQHAGQIDDPTHVIVDGRHYVILPDKPRGYGGFLGFGGAEFRIRFYDGREVTSHNLWTQGNIPDRFRGRIPDNAEFVR